MAERFPVIDGLVFSSFFVVVKCKVKDKNSLDYVFCNNSCAIGCGKLLSQFAWRGIVGTSVCLSIQSQKRDRGKKQPTNFFTNFFVDALSKDPNQV